MNGLRMTEEQFAAYESGKKLALQPAKKSKFGNVRTGAFDSQKEAARFRDLEILERAGVITDLKHHVSYPLHIHGELICHYEADFVYFDLQKDLQVVEDAKGFRTDVYKIKKKLMLAVHGIDILET